MTKTEAIIRSILGPVRGDIRPLVCSVDRTAHLLFVQRVPMDDILVTKEVYPIVAQQLSKTPGAISRKVERLANACWDALVTRNLVTEYIGAPLKDIHSPRDMIFYLAFYAYLDVPFFQAIGQQPTLLF